MSEHTGKIDFRHGGETYQTWYKVFGNLKSGVRPTIVLHGGPGTSHHYVLPFADLHTRFNIPVVFYDQIGIGDSSHPKDVPEEFWTIELFMDELDNLLECLDINKEFDLCGHSWGGMLAAHYASYRHPAGLRHLVIASGAPSISHWMKGVYQVLERLPKDVTEVMKKHEKGGTTEHPEYKAAVLTFNKKNGCLLDPWPQEVLDSLASIEADPVVSKTMFGTSMLTDITGTFRDWSCLEQIHTITVPTLLTNGMEDRVTDAVVAPFFQKIPRVRWVTFAKSSHLAHFEERERFFTVVGEFLTEA